MNRFTRTAAMLVAVMATAGLAGVAHAATTTYASSVVSATQGLRANGTAVLPADSNTANALGAPDGAFYALGFGGSITLAFPNYVGSNLSLTTYEITNGTYPLETARVEVSQNGSTWTLVSTSTNSNGSGSNPHTTTFQLPLGTCVKYVRITDTSNAAAFEATANGIDLDAVSAQYDATCTPPQPPVVRGNVQVTNASFAFVHNSTHADASTGGNIAFGSAGGHGGTGGSASAMGGGPNSGGNAVTGGNGGYGGAGGIGGSVVSGSATAESRVLQAVNTHFVLIR